MLDCLKTRTSLSLPGIELLFLRFIRKCKFFWDDNIKKGLQEMGFEGMNWIELAQNWDNNNNNNMQMGCHPVAVAISHIFYIYMYIMASTCECGNEPSGCINCGEFLD